MINIITNTNIAFYSAYRPIFMELSDASGDTAYLRGELQTKTGLYGTWASTNILINAYQNGTNTPNPGDYTFNLMSYCRPFISKGVCPINSGYINFLKGDMESAYFRLKVWSVKYSATTTGLLYDDMSDIVTGQAFAVTATICNEDDSLNPFNGYENMGAFVVGTNNLGSVSTQAPLTNMPITPTSSPLHTINVNDYPCDSYYQPVSLPSTDTFCVLICAYGINGTNTMNTVTLPSVWEELVRIPLHPKTLEAWYLLHTGTALNTIIDGSGNLIADKVAILAGSVDGSGNFKNWRHRRQSDNSYEIDYRYINYSDEPSNGKCNEQRTKFVFKNMRGGYDWFNAYGTHTKSVKVGGSQFDSLTQPGDRGSHSRKKLWTTREDTFSVISQPLTTEYAEWLQELVSSPQVWVQDEMKYNQSSSSQPLSFLRPVIIDSGDVEIYNTEDNVSYIEFKYKYSNAITTQKG